MVFIALIYSLTSTLCADLGLFSTKTLVELNPDHKVEVRTQKLQAPDQNFDNNGNRVWRCESSRSVTNVARFAQYQAASFQESLKVMMIMMLLVMMIMNSVMIIMMVITLAVLSGGR